MVRFQKLTRNLFLTLHRQQRQLSKFLMCYQQFASHAYCGASFQDGLHGLELLVAHALPTVLAQL
jgi:hypothetical protein